MADQSIHLFGIRHHGPGSARSLCDALEKLQPDCVLIEGPPEADPLMKLVVHEEMQPPVAIVAYCPDEPSQAVFYPFALFSPEWQAMKFAISRNVTVRFFDLPQSNWMALKQAKLLKKLAATAEEKGAKNDIDAEDETSAPASSEPSAGTEGERSAPVSSGKSVGTEGESSAPVGSNKSVGTDGEASAPEGSNKSAGTDGKFFAPADSDQPAGDEIVPDEGTSIAGGSNSENTGEDEHTHASDESDEQSDDTSISSVRRDPLSWLARAAGYSDGERWWESLVEQRVNSEDLFEAIREAMTSLRNEIEGEEPSEEVELDNLREAHMRQSIRTAQKEGYKKIAVVCGAWHTPALAEMRSAKEDTALLKGLPKRKVETTWIPWTHGRLSYRTGYGAGVNSPGWYHHLWSHSDMISERWLSHVARLLRSEDLDASPASIIEATRLADTLAALRDRPLAGLMELTEATKSVLCFGNEVPMRLIHDKLIVGEILGTVPAETPTIPLDKDLQSEQKRLRMPASASEKVYDLDLRKDSDLQRSRLLHRLNILEIAWGQQERVSGKAGTFHEVWRVLWRPEFSVDLIERGVWGRTIQEASNAFSCDKAINAELPLLTKLLDKTLLAELPTATEFIMSRVETQAAIASDIRQLMDALPPLAQIARYGDVRKTNLDAVKHVTDGLVARICIGLPLACASLDNDAAEEMFSHVQAVNGAIAILQAGELEQMWRGTLRQLAGSDAVHGLIAGRACRILLELRDLDAEEAARRFAAALSLAVQPDVAAAWSEGFLKGSGLLLIHNDLLWQVINSWVEELNEDAFKQILPLMRRTFSSFTRPERRQMGERAAQGGTRRSRSSMEGSEIDTARADKVLLLAAKILGLSPPSNQWPSEGS